MRRANTLAYKDIGHIELPEELADEVVSLLGDPLRPGRVKYGEMRKLCYILFSNWVREQQERAQLLSGEPIPPVPEL